MSDDRVYERTRIGEHVVVTTQVERDEDGRVQTACAITVGDRTVALSSDDRRRLMAALVAVDHPRR